MSDIPLILFAKIPIAGNVKTRLTPDLSMQQAAEVAKVLLSETLALATEHWPGKVILAVWPDVNDSFIQQQLNRYEVDHINQVDGDLGRKMFSAMEAVGYPCAVMGCDVPHVPSGNLLMAHSELDRGQDVLGPTDDGGYYLLGLQQSQEMLFSNQTWGQESVLEDSLEKAKKVNLSFTYLENEFDIDTYTDLVNASKTLKILGKFLK